VLGHLHRPLALLDSLLLVMPLFLFYQAGILYQLLVVNRGTLSINGADYLTLSALRWCAERRWLYAVLVAVVALALVLMLRWMSRRSRLSLQRYPAILFESVLYALFFSSFLHLLQSSPTQLSPVHSLLALAGPKSPWEMLFHSAGAGFNEEMVFRLGLFGGIVHASRRLRFPRTLALVLAFVLSSAAFSAIHYFGPYGDVFAFDSFMYRLLAGVLLATLYWWRGLAVAVYTHVLYDVYFFFVLNG
jgi:hypothetical protein